MTNLTVFLIYFDDTVNLPNKPEARHETYRPCKEEKQKYHDQRISKVQEGGGGVFNVQLGDEVVAAVYEEVASSRPRGEEGAPPPVIVLGAEVEVAEEDGGLGARDHKDQEHEE